MAGEGITEWIIQGGFATDEEAGKSPECFTQREWVSFWPAAKMSVGAKKIKFDRVLSLACEDCQDWYQSSQLDRGRCNPPKLMITPLFREGVVSDE